VAAITWREYGTRRRAYLKAVRANDTKAALRLLRRYPDVLKDAEALLAPIYFGRPDVAKAVVDALTVAFRRREFYHGWLYELIHWFGEAEYREVERDVVRFLSHPHHSVRYIALNVLTLHWKTPEYRAVYERMLREDRHEYNRVLAASGLGYVLAGTRDRRASRLLARVVGDRSEDQYVRESAYRALRDVNISKRRREREVDGPPRRDDSADERKAWVAWVDWNFVASAGRAVRTRDAKAPRGRRPGPGRAR